MSQWVNTSVKQQAIVLRGSAGREGKLMDEYNVTCVD